jgi:hypothetical protein
VLGAGGFEKPRLTPKFEINIKKCFLLPEKKKEIWQHMKLNQSNARSSDPFVKTSLLVSSYSLVLK